MEMKDVYEKPEQMGGGAELIAAIKGDVSKLNGEAKTNRESGAKSAAKVKAVWENLGLESVFAEKSLLVLRLWADQKFRRRFNQCFPSSSAISRKRR